MTCITATPLSFARGKWKIRNISIFSIPTFGKAERIFGMMISNISFKGGGGFICPSFCFDRDNFCAILKDKINFLVFVGKISGSYLKLSAKLLQDIVFSQRPFELVVCLQENCTVVNAGHVFQKTGVEYKELKLIQPVKRRQRVCIIYANFEILTIWKKIVRVFTDRKTKKHPSSDISLQPGCLYV